MCRRKKERERERDCLHVYRLDTKSPHAYTRQRICAKPTMCAFTCVRRQRFFFCANPERRGRNAARLRYSQQRLAARVIIGQLSLCGTSFIMTEILIRSRRCSFVERSRSLLGDEFWSRAERQQIEGGLSYEGAGLHYSAVLRQILNEKPREADRRLYLIKPL